MAKGEWQVISPPERSRTYHYDGGEFVVYFEVSRIKVSESGNHYIEAAGDDENGEGRGTRAVKAIVAPGWRRITLDIDAWTF